MQSIATRAGKCSPSETRPRSPHDGPDARRKRHEPRRGAEPAVGRRLARATQRVAIVLLADQFPSACPEKPLRPTVSVRAPWEILPFQLIVETVYFPFKAGRADSLQAVLCPRAGGNWPNNRKLFGQFPTPAVARGRAIPTSWNCPQAGQAPLTPRRRAHRASYWPSGREKGAEKIPAKWEKFFPRNFGPNRISTAAPRTVDSSRLRKFPATPIRNVFFF